MFLEVKVTMVEFSTQIKLIFHLQFIYLRNE